MDWFHVMFCQTVLDFESKFPPFFRRTTTNDLSNGFKFQTIFFCFLAVRFIDFHDNLNPTFNRSSSITIIVKKSKMPMVSQGSLEHSICWSFLCEIIERKIWMSWPFWAENHLIFRLTKFVSICSVTSSALQLLLNAFEELAAKYSIRSKFHSPRCVISTISSTSFVGINLKVLPWILVSANGLKSHKYDLINF